MELAREILAWVLILGGCFFVIVGAVGLVRFPDVYTRVHAAGVTDTVGAALLLGGLTLYGGFTIVTIKLLLILAFIFFTSPTSSNAFANAVYSAGIKPLLAKPEGSKEDESSKPS
jgi:multicomponent Na+:H+ antiporter subunit G